MSISTLLLVGAGWTVFSCFAAWAFFALGFGFEVAQGPAHRHAAPIEG